MVSLLLENGGGLISPLVSLTVLLGIFSGKGSTLRRFASPLLGFSGRRSEGNKPTAKPAHVKEGDLIF